MASASYFVTGTGTGIGKTYVTSGIIRAARALGRDCAAIKPVISGFHPDAAAGSDPALLLAAMDRAVTMRNIAAISPWRFFAPLSPDMAAMRENRHLDFKTVLAFCEAAMAAAPGTLLIEGAGGAAVPLDDTYLVVDWIAALRIPTILVAGTYLGTISHTISTIECLAASKVPVVAIVLSESLDGPVSPEETRDTLARFLPQPIYIVPRNHNEQSFMDLAQVMR